MAEKKDGLEIFIKEELEREAEELRAENEAEKEPMPEEVKARIKMKLDEQIEEYEWKRKYPGLSEEELRALRIGQEILDKEKAEAEGGKDAGSEDGLEDPDSPKEKGAGRKARGFRFYGGMVAVLALVLTVGMTSLGGAERVVRFMKSVVGDREIMKVNSSDKNLVIVEENEEEAYYTIKEEFGIEPVKIIMGSLGGMRFENMELDKFLQVAQLSYSYSGENVAYFISASYRDGSLGMDIEDQLKDQYQIEKSGCIINVKEYEIQSEETSRYSASFTHKGLEYFLTGTMKKEEFELILKKLHIFS